MKKIFILGRPVDKYLLFSFLVLIAFSLLIFFSASLGLASRSPSLFKSALFSQLALGYGIGIVLAYLLSRINYKWFGVFSVYFFAVALLLTFLTHVPSLGITSGGATRWINIFGISFQPSELLKPASVIFISYILSIAHKKRNKDQIKQALIPTAVIIALVAVALLSQPDTGTFLVIVGSVAIVLFVYGIKWKYLGLGIVALSVVLSAYVFMHPYIIDRISTFISSSDDLMTKDYHINQAKIAIGSGGLFGRGFGKSLQKFKYLPEPASDSVFAVYAEEAGFVGSVVLLIVFLTFYASAFRIGFKMLKKNDLFAFLLVIGIVSSFVIQTILNIGSMTGVLPLTGLTLPFVSKGGTSVLISFLSIGILFSVSRFTTRKRRF